MSANMGNIDLDRLLKKAINEWRLVAFTLTGRPRIAEPHDYGLIEGEPRLFFYQVGGESSPGSTLGWRWAVLSKISEFRVLDRRFRGPRPVPSGKHLKWDRLFATVRLTTVKDEA